MVRFDKFCEMHKRANEVNIRDKNSSTRDECRGSSEVSMCEKISGAVG